LKRQPIPTGQRGERPRIPAFDIPPVRHEGLRARVPEVPSKDIDRLGGPVAVRGLQVDAVVRGYAVAVRKVYGTSFYCKDITRTRAYPQLVQAAEILLEHDIPPGEWAEWRLTFAKEKGEPAWPLGRVMQPASIKKLRGYFRHAGKVDATPRRDWKPYHDEQRYRAREADLLWKWGENPPMLTFPKTYTDMRAKERKLGKEYADPLYNWPSPNNAPATCGAR
jgi:hypothetical protein